MSGSAFQTVFNLGPQITGSILGSPYQQYRATSALLPTGDGSLLATISAWITADAAGKGTKAFTYAKPVAYGWFDPTITQVGDYLIGPLGTFFISSLDVPQPLTLVRCNATVTVSQTNAMPSLGVQNAYGGDQRATEVILATEWPCSMLQGTKGEVGSSKLPGDAKQPWSAILMPPIPGVTLRNDMILTDQDNQRHITSSVELTPLGYRITAMLATT